MVACWFSNDHPATGMTPDGLPWCVYHVIDGPGRDHPTAGFCRGCGKVRRETWPIPSGQPDALGYAPRVCSIHLALLIEAMER